MVESPEGQIVFDLAGGSFGRGAWTHPTEECLRRTAKAMRNSRHKASPQPSSPEIDDLALLLSALADAANRRAKGLVSAAYRAGHLALGSDASAAEFAVGRARLVLLSTDARAASKENWLEAAVARGTVVVWASKAELGALVGREELAVFVVTDEGLARSLRQVLALTTPVTSRLAGATLAVARSAVTTMATGSHGLEDSEDG
jgi:ribosomal protein L7Ae-like RNA K-turn-binding protein